MVKVPAGEFRYEITNPQGRAGRSWNLKIKPFHVANTETTVAQYQIYLNEMAGRDVFKAQPETEWEPDSPMRDVDWYHCVAFCNWLSDREGFDRCYFRKTIAADDTDSNAFSYVCDPSRSGYRLPSEAEWEYFCRADSKLTYSFGDARDRLPDYSVFATSTASPVARRLPNQWGLFDCHGNVWEWCTDVNSTLSFEERTRRKGFDDANQIAVEVGDATYAGVLRGGCFDSNADVVRSISYHPSKLDNGDDRGGFRLVMGDSGDRPESRRRRVNEHP